MPYTMKTEGLEDVEALLNTLGDKAGSVASAGLYDGAGVMADEIQRQVNAIRTEEFRYTVFGQRAPSPEEKAALQSVGAGIAKFDKNGSEVDTSVGFSNAGYADVNGKRKPIPQIANAINSGTSFMKAQPFFRKAVNSGRTRAVEAISRGIEEKVDALIKQSGG
jgi:hypothetical protein